VPKKLEMYSGIELHKKAKTTPPFRYPSKGGEIKKPISFLNKIGF
jgi:hypothetical protein